MLISSHSDRVFGTAGLTLGWCVIHTNPLMSVAEPESLAPTGPHSVGTQWLFGM